MKRNKIVNKLAIIINLGFCIYLGFKVFNPDHTIEGLYSLVALLFINQLLDGITFGQIYEKLERIDSYLIDEFIECGDDCEECRLNEEETICDNCEKSNREELENNNNLNNKEDKNG